MSRTTWTRIRLEARQRRHHRAFRIAAPVWDDAQLAELDRLIAEIDAATEVAGARRAAASQPAAPTPPEGEPRPDQLDEKVLADAATNLWRAQRKLAGDGGRPSGQARQAGRYLRACHEALTDAGLVVQDHDGDGFHPGRSLEVLVFQDDPSLTAETVLETVRPSIYFGDRRIQMGQVIVGSPSPPETIEGGPENHEAYSTPATIDHEDNHA